MDVAERHVAPLLSRLAQSRRLRHALPHVTSSAMEQVLLFGTVLVVVLSATFVVDEVRVPVYTPNVGFLNRDKLKTPSWWAEAEATSPADSGIVPAPLQRIVAIGDLHGDYDRLRNLLRAAEVLDENYDRWREGCTDVVVQLGNVVGSGPDVAQMLQLLAQLKWQAKSAGGRVITLSGDGELAALAGRTADVHPQQLAASGGAVGFRHLFGAGGRYGRIIVEENLAIALVSDIVFVPGGLTIEYAHYGIDNLNAEWFRRAHRGNVSKHPYMEHESPLQDRSVVQAAMRGDCGPLTAALASLSTREQTPVTMMVVGHTPMTDGVVGSWCDSRLQSIDVAMSRYVDKGGYEAFISFRPPTKKSKKRASTLAAKDRLDIHYPLGRGGRVNTTEAAPAK